MKSYIAEAFLFTLPLLLACAVAIGGIIETINAPPVKDVATAYAETLLPGKQYRVVCPDGGAPALCAIVYENNGSVTVIPIRCGRLMGSCGVRSNQ